jgi:hypothetical protein
MERMAEEPEPRRGWAGKKGGKGIGSKKVLREAFV